MPNYAFKCEKCDHKFDEILSMKDNDKPTKLPCPKCKKKKVVRDWGENTNSLAYDMSLNPAKVIGKGWNDVINKIKKTTPPRLHDRLEQSRTFNAGRFVR